MKYLLLAGLSALTLLAGCAAVEPPRTAELPAPNFSVMEDNLLQEAKRLGNLVAGGALTRLEAADQLNARRLAMVGPHPVDDEVFRTYRDLSRQLQQKKISQEKLRNTLMAKLETMRQGYAALEPKPLKPPVFTNMLLKIYERPPL